MTTPDDETLRKAHVRRRRTTAGVTLIVLGFVFYALRRWEAPSTDFVLGLLGAAFLAAYLLRRIYGFLIPAGILLGLSAGTFFGEWPALAGVNGTQLGLGLGFVSIYVIALVYERRNQWWPLIPGGLLLVSAFPWAAEVWRAAHDNWPLVLVLVGVLILLGAWRAGADGGAGKA